MGDGVLTPGEGRFAAAAVRRKRLFLWLSLAGVAAAAGLLILALLPSEAPGGGSPGLRAAVVVLVLLNARQNLRQYRYACVLEKLRAAAAGPQAPQKNDAG